MQPGFQAGLVGDADKPVADLDKTGAFKLFQGVANGDLGHTQQVREVTLATRDAVGLLASTQVHIEDFSRPGRNSKRARVIIEFKQGVHARRAGTPEPGCEPVLLLNKALQGRRVDHVNLATANRETIVSELGALERHFAKMTALANHADEVKCTVGCKAPELHSPTRNNAQPVRIIAADMKRLAVAEADPPRDREGCVEGGLGQKIPQRGQVKIQDVHFSQDYKILYLQMAGPNATILPRAQARPIAGAPGPASWEEAAMKVLDENMQPDEFREYARTWLAENAPPAPPERLPIAAIEVMTPGQRDYLQAWQRQCYEAGLVGVDYPVEYGGHGQTGLQRIANQEMNRAEVPFLINIVGLSMAAPTILMHGTEAQKRQFLPGCLSGDEIWCQGFSEPGAGSDLSNQSTTAVRDGDDWIVNGHKVWTSLGHFATWMILVTRTSKEDRKHDGLTYFLCPIEGHAGVTVRPLLKITGETGFNEVFFDDVRIPDAYRLDEVGKGWSVAMTTLLSERGAAENAGSGGGGGEHALTALIDLSRESWRDGVLAADDPVTRDALMQSAIVAEGLRQNARRMRVSSLCDHPMRLPLQQKLTHSEFQQDIARLGVEIAGASASLYKLDPKAPSEGHWPLAYLNSYGVTIAAGTNEIQRNILGERVLGLPKSK